MATQKNFVIDSGAQTDAIQPPKEVTKQETIPKEAEKP